jgi:hypothetical protein
MGTVESTRIALTEIILTSDSSRVDAGFKRVFYKL